MKNTFYKLTVILLIMLFFQSCKKETINEQSKKDAISFKSKDELLDIKIINNPHDIKTYISNPEDEDDEKIQNQLLDLGYLSRDLFETNSYNSIIFDKASKNRNSTISFTDFIVYLEENEEEEAKILSEFIGNIDLTHKPKNQNSDQVEDYIPAIFVPNIDKADFNLQPIISSGINVNCNLDDLKDYEDYIVAWYFDNGKWIEFLLGEEMAMETMHPIFIIDNAEENMTYAQIISYADDIVVNPDYSTTHYSHRYRINYHHESWVGGRSELWIAAAAIYDDGSVRQVLLDGNNYKPSKSLANVKRSWVGTWRWQYQQFCSTDNYSGNKKVYWNTYERDWDCSNKDLGSASNFGATIYLEGRMEYSSEWYAFRPREVQNHPFDLNTVSSYIAENWNGGYLVEDN